MTFETYLRIFHYKADDAFHCQWSQALGAGSAGFGLHC